MRNFSFESSVLNDMGSPANPYHHQINSLSLGRAWPVAPDAPAFA